MTPAELRIVTLPHPVLREKARPVDAPPISEQVAAVARRMIDLMFQAEGIGLAAPQVGLPWRLFVAHVPEDPEEGRTAAASPAECTAAPEVYLNPVLSAPSADLEPFEEGCLSLPKIRGRVMRPSQITITATDPTGNRFTRRAGGLLARCWQHEMDHLDGVLIIDRMLQPDRLKNRNAIKALGG
jgi:peptide deformylase